MRHFNVFHIRPWWYFLMLMTSTQCSAFQYRGVNWCSPLSQNSKCKPWREKQLVWASVSVFISVSAARWSNHVWQGVMDLVQPDNLPLWILNMLWWGGVMSDGRWQLLLHLQGHLNMPFFVGYWPCWPCPLWFVLLLHTLLSTYLNSHPQSLFVS